MWSWLVLGMEVTFKCNRGNVFTSGRIAVESVRRFITFCVGRLYSLVFPPENFPVVIFWLTRRPPLVTLLLSYFMNSWSPFALAVGKNVCEVENPPYQISLANFWSPFWPGCVSMHRTGSGGAGNWETHREEDWSWQIIHPHLLNSKRVWLLWVQHVDLIQGVKHSVSYSAWQIEMYV